MVRTGADREMIGGIILDVPLRNRTHVQHTPHHFGAQMFLATREKLFVKRIVKRLLKTHSIVSAENPSLSGIELYREILLRTKNVDPSSVDRLLSQAEDSVDLWTTSAVEEMRFREVVHFLVMSQHREAGNIGTAVSFRDIIYSMIPDGL